MMKLWIFVAQLALLIPSLSSAQSRLTVAEIEQRIKELTPAHSLNRLIKPDLEVLGYDLKSGFPVKITVYLRAHDFLSEGIILQISRDSAKSYHELPSDQLKRWQIGEVVKKELELSSDIKDSVGRLSFAALPESPPENLLKLAKTYYEKGSCHNVVRLSRRIEELKAPPRTLADAMHIKASCEIYRLGTLKDAAQVEAVFQKIFDLDTAEQFYYHYVLADYEMNVGRYQKAAGLIRHVLAQKNDPYVQANRKRFEDMLSQCEKFLGSRK